MANVKIVKMKVRHSPDDQEQMWHAVADFAGQEVWIPLPARFHDELPFDVLHEEALVGMENLAQALLDFAETFRRSHGLT